MDKQAVKNAVPIFWTICLSLCLHLAILAAFSRLPHHASSTAAARQRLTPLAVTLMKPSVPASEVPGSARKSKESSVARARRNKAANATVPIVVPQAAPSDAREQSGQLLQDAPARRAGAISLSAEARRSAGKIDRELRQSAPTLPQPQPRSLQSALEKGLAAAARPGNAGMTEVTLPDGRRMTKVTGPNGSYCVMRESAAAIGIDPQRGPQTMVTTCP